PRAVSPSSASPMFVSPRTVPPLDSPSFPTRRSSDLSLRALHRARDRARQAAPPCRPARAVRGRGPSREPHLRRRDHAAPAPVRRSEEHTSELQSRFDLVCRLLLEQKKPSKASLRETK